MQNLFSFKGGFSNEKAGVTAQLLLIHFVDENGIHIIYSPHLDISGYGKNMDEAKQSFEDSFADFMDYTINKKTLSKVLKQLGWKVKAGSKLPKKILTPTMADILNKSYVSEIFDKYQTQTFHTPVQIPQFS